MESVAGAKCHSIMPRCEATLLVIGVKANDIAYHRIPRTSTQAESVIADAKATDAVVVALKSSNLITPENIPNL
jgi:hypothetical protein